MNLLWILWHFLTIWLGVRSQSGHEWRGAILARGLRKPSAETCCLLPADGWPLLVWFDRIAHGAAGSGPPGTYGYAPAEVRARNYRATVWPGAAETRRAVWWDRPSRR